jgi:hypothetical protein
MDPSAALALAASLLAEHGLHDWTVTLDRARTRAGACRFARRQVSLSAPLTRLHSEAEVRDTILHEVAHALVGPGHQHDEVWRATALRIGGSGQRCVPPDAPRVAGDWVGRCPAGHERHRHRRPQRPQSCARCRPTFDARHLLSWTYRGRTVRLSESYETELALLTLASGGAGPHGGHDSLTAPPAPLPSGARARCLAPGKYYGVVGQVVKRGRTRYHLRVPSGVLTVPFALVEALQPDH